MQLPMPKVTIFLLLSIEERCASAEIHPRTLCSGCSCQKPQAPASTAAEAVGRMLPASQWSRDFASLLHFLFLLLGSLIRAIPKCHLRGEHYIEQTPLFLSDEFCCPCITFMSLDNLFSYFSGGTLVPYKSVRSLAWFTIRDLPPVACPHLRMKPP